MTGGRDDSVLYPGSSSASFSSVRTHQVAESRKKSNEDKREKRNELRPVAEIVLGEVKREKQETMMVKNLDITHAKDPESFMIEMLARKRYVEYLDTLRNKLSNVLREPATIVKEETLND